MFSHCATGSFHAEERVLCACAKSAGVSTYAVRKREKKTRKGAKTQSSRKAFFCENAAPLRLCVRLF